MSAPDRHRAADEAATLNEFFATLLADQAAGRQQSVDHYLALFPQHRTRIAEEFTALTAEPVAAALPSIPQVELEREIARGGQGVVYRGRQAFLDRTVAVKVLAASAIDAPFTNRFRREARTLAGLTHPNIVACHHAGVADDGTCYLVMEFVDGPTLRRWLDDHGAMPVHEALAMARDLAGALAHALAAGIVHRDVKPENVLLQPLPDAPAGTFPYRAKLVDLGLARPLRLDRAVSQATPIGMVIGTPETMAPEQFDAPDSVDQRADIYGLGCVLHHALTGRPAFRHRRMTDLMARKAGALGPDPRQLVGALPAAVAELVMRMTASSPADRPATWDAVLATFDRLLAVRPRPSRPGRRLLLAAAVAMLAGLSLATWWPPARGTPAAVASAPPRLRPIGLFADGDDPFLGWHCDGEPGRDEAGAPNLNRTRGLGEARRTLAPGPFSLRGKLAPVGRFDGGKEMPVDRTGLRIEYADGRALELDLRPLANGYRATWRSLRRDAPASPWSEVETLATMEGTWNGTTPLPFRLRCDADGATGIVAELGDGPAAGSVRFPTGAGSATLVLFVAGGCTCFPAFELSGT